MDIKKPSYYYVIYAVPIYFWCFVKESKTRDVYDIMSQCHNIQHLQ